MQYNFKNLELYYYKSLPTVWKELNKLQTLKKLIPKIWLQEERSDLHEMPNGHKQSF